MPEQERHYYQVMYNGSEYDPYNGQTTYEPIKPYDLMTHFMSTHWIGKQVGAQVERVHYEAGHQQTFAVFSSEQVLDSETLKRICACGGWLPDTIRPVYDTQGQMYSFVPQKSEIQ